MQYTYDVIELYTWILCNYINQRHPQKFNLKKKKQEKVNQGKWSRACTGVDGVLHEIEWLEKASLTEWHLFKNLK